MTSLPRVALGDVIVPAERSEQPVAGVAYRQIGVRLWGEGAYERETIDGSQTSYNRLYRTAEGDIIVNKIWARNGSVAVVPANLVGCYASGEFPMFAPDPGKLLPRWFHWFTKTQDLWRQCDEKSRGTSGKNRIRPEKFLEITLPLPPLAEQQRIVARIDALAARIEEAKGLRAQAVAEVEATCRAILFDKRNDLTLTPMRRLVELRETDVSVEPAKLYQFAGVYSFGRGVFRSVSKQGSEFSYARLTRLNTNDFVFPKLMAWEGAFGMVPQECEGCVVSPEFPVFRVNQERVLPEVLDFYFKTPAIWPVVSGISTGTNVRRRRLHPARFLDYDFPLPSMSIQHKLRQLTRQLYPIRRLQAETQAELDALLPSVLDRAFRGEL